MEKQNDWQSSKEISTCLELLTLYIRNGKLVHVGQPKLNRRESNDFILLDIFEG